MIIFYIVLIYLAIGIGFTIYFFNKWIWNVDEAATDTDWQFLLIIAPGCILLWPVLFKKVLLL